MMRLSSLSFHAKLSLTLALAMILVVGTALMFEHVGGYIPCKLCLEQRTPYYVAIPIALLAFIVSAALRKPWLARVLLAFCAILMGYGFYLAVFHSGVEWGFWPGPTDCGVVADTSEPAAGDLLSAIDRVVPPACDEAAGRFLGLSFAGWNAVASLILTLIALIGAVANGRHGSSSTSQ